MNTTLTKDDLAAIGELIDDRVPKIMAEPLLSMENRLVARIDDLDDVLSLQMEHGLPEVHDQLASVAAGLSSEISEVKTVVDRIDRVQQTELARNDHQDEAIKKLRKNLHAV
jgi:hypothetical protein